VGWPIDRQRRILAECFDLMGSDGIFLEFSYGPCSPVPRELIREFDFVAARISFVWRNFPPATIWGYRLAA
jgi:phosphatidylethanolamine/phosphatidyl-N-methylethanolamine N-methyltransferase